MFLLHMGPIVKIEVKASKVNSTVKIGKKRRRPPIKNNIKKKKLKKIEN